jgi:hypothetical protein
LLQNNGIQLYNPNSPVDSNGNRTQTFANNDISQYINSVAAAMVKYFPNPNVAATGYNYVSPDDTIKDHYWSFITRIDHQLTQSQKLTGIFFRSVRNQLYPTQGFPIGGIKDRKYDLNQIFSHNLITFGSVRAAQEIMRDIPSGYPRYLTLSRNFTADQLTRNNAVLIGGMKSVPWDHVFDDLLNFITDYDYTSGVQFVRNRRPKPGEQGTYAVSNAPDNMTGYAVVAYLPNPSRTGHIIILAGTDSEATGAAASFLTSEEKLSSFRDQLHSSKFPYFEVLLKTSRVSDTFFNAEPIGPALILNSIKSNTPQSQALTSKIAALAAGTLDACGLPGFPNLTFVEVSFGAVSVSNNCHFG